MKIRQKIDIKNLTLDDLTELLGGLGKERFRARQLMQWIYRHGVVSFDAMTTLSKEFRRELAQIAFISTLTPQVVEESRDGTRKFLFLLGDGESIEAVRIPMDKERATLCVSTQVGCAMGCAFCLTGTLGLRRNLDTAEIVNQVCAVMAEEPVGNIVFMGMGEPLANFDNVVKALNILQMEEGFDFSARKLTISTCGLVPEMKRFGEGCSVGLAVSLNAATDEVRDRLMPVNRRYPLAQLMAACRGFPLKQRQRITFEYILIQEVNDSLEDARRLVRLLHGVKAKVNLIPFNEHPASSFRRPPEDRIEAFQKHLLDRGLVAVRRASKGEDISAACGQLKGSRERRDEADGLDKAAVG
ncbi:MAG: 23S rRNA (adenine(2503)-C(2))-methyltransferase RlmN [Desulfuromonadaceae bacterium]|nr:23S rRNA (adenine(2503)-C(2))-methyltransferase RlmN [Desulfuromonadaceae bacterium]